MDLKLLLVILISVFFFMFVAQTQADFGNNLYFLQEASVAVQQTCGSFNLGQIFVCRRAKALPFIPVGNERCLSIIPARMKRVCRAEASRLTRQVADDCGRA